MSDINYNVTPQNPLPGMMQAIQFGQYAGGIRDQRAQAVAQAEAAKQAALEKLERDKQIDETMSLIGKNPTGENFMKLARLFPPKDSESVNATWSQMDKSTQQSMLTEAMNVFSALENNELGIAKKDLETRRDAYINSNNKEGAEKTQVWIDMIDNGKAQAVKNIYGMMITTIPGGKDAIDALAKLNEDQRTKRLAEKLESERPEGTNIDESARKVINSAVESAISSDLLASQAQNLADGFMKSKPPAGWSGSALDWMKKAIGGQDQFTRLKQEYVKLRNTDVLKNLPPGVASDKDIEIALSAFPPDNSSPEYITEFLQGMAKLQRYSSAVNKAKAEWVNQNGSLGPAQVPFKAGGQDVNKGMTFWDFTKAIPMPNVIGNGQTIITGGK